MVNKTLYTRSISYLQWLTEVSVSMRFTIIDILNMYPLCCSHIYVNMLANGLTNAIGCHVAMIARKSKVIVSIFGVFVSILGVLRRKAYSQRIRNKDLLMVMHL